MSNNIFINYRRDDTGGITLAIYKELIKHFRPENIFKDFNTIKPGSDFVESIHSALAKCDLLLVFIGKNWLTMKDEYGNNRIENPLDYVRIEIEHAIGRNIKILPILIDNVKMPQESDLPDGLKPLVRRQSVSVEIEKFDSDIFSLVNTIKEILGIVDPEAKLAHDIVTGKVRTDDIVKPESNTAYAVVCTVLGLLLVALNEGDGVGGVGTIMAGVGGYFWYQSTLVKKAWLSSDFERARSLSRNVRKWSLIAALGGLVLAVGVALVQGLNDVGNMMQNQNY